MNAPLLPDGRYVVVVRRGDTSLLFGLGSCLECTENVEVIQDRRFKERRSGLQRVDHERRARDRRQTVLGPALAILAQIAP
jgi:hypothetical protein